MDDTLPDGLQSLVDTLAEPNPNPAYGEATLTVPVDRYTREEDHLAEQRLLRELPFVVAESVALPEARSYFAHDSSGIPLVITRGDDGEVRGFLNTCRHRGARLCPRGSAGRSSSLRCPYHGWTYGLDGRFSGRPQPAAFGAEAPGTSDLVEVPVAEAHGLVWASARPGPPLDLGSWLGAMSADLDWLDLAGHVPFRVSRVARRANWKLIVEAFLEPYHVPILHQGTVGTFFEPWATAARTVGPHVRSASARRPRPTDTPRSESVRERFTFSWVVFPATVLIAHPDFVSRISVFPIDPGQLLFEHTMLVPRSAALTDAERYARSFDLIDGGVFQGEDLDVIEQVQEGLGAGGIDVMRFGRIEHALTHFHQTLADTLDHALAHPRSARSDAPGDGVA